MKNGPRHRWNSVPTIVVIVLAEATRLRTIGWIMEGEYKVKLRRIEIEELEPLGLRLLIRDLQGGDTRFIIKEAATGEVLELLEFGPDGAPKTECAGALADALHQ